MADVEDISDVSDSLMEDAKKSESDGDKCNPDVDSLTQKMSKTSISQKKVSFMGPLRPKFKQNAVETNKSRRMRRLILLRIIDNHPYATIIETDQNLEALNLEY
jgi:hypothetical protein